MHTSVHGAWKGSRQFKGKGKRITSMASLSCRNPILKTRIKHQEKVVRCHRTYSSSLFWAFCLSALSGEEALITQICFFPKRVRIVPVFAAKEHPACLSERILEQFGCWLISGAYSSYSKQALIYTRDDSRQQPRSNCFCPGFALCPCPQQPTHTRATGCSASLLTLLQHSLMPLLCKVPKESVSASPSLNNKPQKAGRAEGAPPLFMLSSCFV